jgi:hypothetical protein
MLGKRNREYYRDITEYPKAVEETSCLNFRVFNGSDATADNAKMEISIEDAQQMLIVRDACSA